ncbi:MAG: HD-GYP domain-containing protein [Actinomycetota bacterium]
MSTFVLPTVAVFGILVFGQPHPRPVLAIVLSLTTTLFVVAAGAAVWHAQPESEGHSFGDLMLWSWIRRRNAERRVTQSATVVGLARDGTFRDAGTVSLDARRAALADIAVSLDAKSSYTLGHSTRVQEHARNVADELELSAEETDALAAAALLHNVGNVAIPESVLRKTSDLTDTERSLIEQHVDLGASLALTSGFDRAVVDAIQHHHERWDGAGYPDGLAGETIPPLARIIAVAESYDALASTRPYRDGLSRAGAIAALRDGAGAQLDPMIVEALVATLPSERGILAAAALPAIAQRRIQQTGVAIRRVGSVALSATASTIAIALVLGATVLDSGVPRPADDAGRRQRAVTDEVLGTRISQGGSAQAAAGHDAIDPDLDGGIDGDEETTVAGSIESAPSLVGTTDSSEGTGTTGRDDPSSGSGADGGTTDPGGGTDPTPAPGPTEPEPEPTTEPEPEPTDDGKPGNGNGRDKDKPKDDDGSPPEHSNGNGNSGGKPKH